MQSSWPLVHYLVFAVFGVQVAWFDLVLVHYVSFVFVEYVDFKYSPSGLAILKNVLEIRVALLA